MSSFGNDVRLVCAYPTLCSLLLCAQGSRLQEVSDVGKFAEAEFAGQASLYAQSLNEQTLTTAVWRTVDTTVYCGGGGGSAGYCVGLCLLSEPCCSRLSCLRSSGTSAARESLAKWQRFAAVDSVLTFLGLFLVILLTALC